MPDNGERQSVPPRRSATSGACRRATGRGSPAPRRRGALPGDALLVGDAALLSGAGGAPPTRAAPPPVDEAGPSLLAHGGALAAEAPPPPPPLWSCSCKTCGSRAARRLASHLGMKLGVLFAFTAPNLLSSEAVGLSVSALGPSSMAPFVVMVALAIPLAPVAAAARAQEVRRRQAGVARVLEPLGLRLRLHLCGRGRRAGTRARSR